MSDILLKIKSNDKYNFLKPNADFLSSTWFDEAESFIGTVAKVKLNDKGWNYISKIGKIIFEEWYTKIYDFHCGFCRIYNESRGYNFVDEFGKIISSEWFEYATDFKDDEDGVIYSLVKFKNGDVFKFDNNKNFSCVIIKEIISEEYIRPNTLVYVD